MTEAANAAIDAFAINEALASIWELVDELNGYITEQAPWTLAKDPTDRDGSRPVLATRASRSRRARGAARSRACRRRRRELWDALGGPGAVDAQRIDTAAIDRRSARVAPLETRSSRASRPRTPLLA